MFEVVNYPWWPIKVCFSLFMWKGRKGKKIKRSVAIDVRRERRISRLWVKNLYIHEEC